MEAQYAFFKKEKVECIHYLVGKQEEEAKQMN